MRSSLLKLTSLDIHHTTRVRLTDIGWPSSETDDHPEWPETPAHFDAARERAIEALAVYASREDQ